MNIADLKHQLEDLVNDLATQVNAKKKVTLAAGWALIQDAITQIVFYIDKNVGDTLGNPDKKAAAMVAIEVIIDIVCQVITLPFLPAFMERWLDTYIKKILMVLADGSIDATVAAMHKAKLYFSKTK